MPSQSSPRCHSSRNSITPTIRSAFQALHPLPDVIECIFTLDYEIYGNGQGSLNDLVYAPAERLGTIFKEYDARFVVFVEVAELEMIEAHGSDITIDRVKGQVGRLFNEGFELGLHIHPQWYNARRRAGGWILDYSQYNMCTLPTHRIARILDRSIDYLRHLTRLHDFSPLSFRAGNWLLQPTGPTAGLLAERGIKIDSSVFKGGLQRQHGLDYRRALRNGYWWRFTDEVSEPDARGVVLELPIHTRMVPAWEMFTTKRVRIHQKGPGSVYNSNASLYRLLDYARFQHPLKFDFCRMTLNELTRMIEEVIREDQRDPGSFRPIVAIGHTKDLTDFVTIENFLSYLRKNDVPISTFEEIYTSLDSDARGLG